MLKNPFTKNSLINKYKNLINQINALEENLKEVKRLRQEIADLAKNPTISYLDYLKSSNDYALLMDLKFLLFQP